MAQPKLEQTAYNSCARYERREATAAFDNVTGPGNLIVMTVVTGGGGPVYIQVPTGFVEVRTASIGNVTTAIFYYQNAPSMDSATITVSDDRSIQLRVKEYSHAAQTNCLDQIVVRTSKSNTCHSGFTAITAQADEIIVSVVANSYTSCSQHGYLGGLIRLFESLSPQRYGYRNNIYNDDSDRTRCTIHHLIVAFTGIFYISCQLTTSREWVAIVCTFRGGSSGPKQMSSRLQSNPVVSAGNAKAKAVLYVFGPFKSTTTTPVATSGTSAVAEMFPFDYQYRVGPNKLLIGSNTLFRVQGTNGLYGTEVRSSDSDLPRDSGALRGVDLESARIVQFTMNVGRGRDQVEQNMQALMRALVPQRDEDWPLVWKHPDGPPRRMMCRPISTLRTRSRTSLSYQSQTITLRAADPRHYSAAPKNINIINSGSTPVYTQVVNEGDIPAYPVITIRVPTIGYSVATLTRVTLTNVTAQVIFDVAIQIPPRSVLIGDMQARVTSSASTSSITLNGSSRYGAWKLPREPFRIDPDPLGMGGYNMIRLDTEPAGAAVECFLNYRDTWAG